MLNTALHSLHSLLTPINTKVEIVVADNDPHQSAHPVVAEQRNHFLHASLSYLHVPTRGIVHMRNAVIEYALQQDAQLLAFIDDDETVAPQWLIGMLDTLDQFGAHVVVGRVVRVFPENPPQWIVQGQFFEGTNVPTGTLRKSASTNNVLFDLHKIAIEMGLRFHPALNLSGSSDTFLFGESHRKGARIVWHNDTPVQEFIPATRLTVKWQLNRAFRHNNCRTIRATIRHPRWRVILSEGSYGLVHFLLAIGSLPVNIFRGKAGLVHSLRFFWKGLGSLAGLSGYHYEEYKRIHGH